MAHNLIRMHEAIGRAVLMAQVFETVFVVCIELVLSMRKIDLGKSSEPINPNRFKRYEIPSMMISGTIQRNKQSNATIIGLALAFSISIPSAATE